MKISVICLADRPERLPCLYWSLVAQTHTDWELIVLDQSDSMKVGFGGVMKNMPNTFDPEKVRVIKVDRRGDWGQSVKHTTAQTLALGEAFLFPNDDAYYVPRALELMSNEIIVDGAGLVVCGWLYDTVGYYPMWPHIAAGYLDIGGFMVTRRAFAMADWSDKGHEGDINMVKSVVDAKVKVSLISNVLYVKN